MHPNPPLDEREHLATFAGTQAYTDLHKLLAEHEEALIANLALSHTDSDALAYLRRWQIFRQYRMLLKTPEHLAEALQNERSEFAASIDPMRDPLAPEPPNYLI